MGAWEFPGALEVGVQRGGALLTVNGFFSFFHLPLMPGGRFHGGSSLPCD